MNKLPLTENERDVWGFILGYITDHDYSPTLKEIAVFIGSPHHQAASDYVSRLVDKGYLKRKGRGWRNIRIITKK